MTTAAADALLLSGPVGELTLILDSTDRRMNLLKPNVVLKSERPFALTGVRLRTLTFPKDAVLMVHSGKHVELSVRLEQVSKRPIWPVLLFFPALELRFVAESIAEPFPTRIVLEVEWEQILP